MWSPASASSSTNSQYALTSSSFWKYCPKETFSFSSVWCYPILCDQPITQNWLLSSKLFDNTQSVLPSHVSSLPAQKASTYSVKKTSELHGDIPDVQSFQHSRTYQWLPWMKRKMTCRVLSLSLGSYDLLPVLLKTFKFRAVSYHHFFTVKHKHRCICIKDNYYK